MDGETIKLGLAVFHDLACAALIVLGILIFRRERGRNGAVGGNGGKDQTNAR